jgi:hypothetical protein
MRVHRYGTPAHFSDVPPGECFTFDLDGTTHVAMSILWEIPGKAILVCAELWPGLVEYNNAPGILEADVLGATPVCAIKDATLVPIVQPTHVHHYAP